VRWAWQRLEQTAGAVPIRKLCLQLGWSRKWLVARFRDDIGLTPKTAARVLTPTELLAVTFVQDSRPVSA
jgi:hypothetical protein